MESIKINQNKVKKSKQGQKLNKNSISSAKLSKKTKKNIVSKSPSNKLSNFGTTKSNKVSNEISNLDKKSNSGKNLSNKTNGTKVSKSLSNKGSNFGTQKRQIIICLICGIFVGFINGFFGGGGGMIVVPLLIFLLGLKEKNAHATAILIILPLSITSSIIYITQGGFEFLNLGLTTIGVILGGITGSMLLKKINNTVLRFIFSFIMIVAGVKMMF